MIFPAFFAIIILYICIQLCLTKDHLDYAEVKTWLDTFIEQTMREDAVTNGTTLKMLVDRILVRDDGIEVEFSCGVSIEKKFVR